MESTEERLKQAEHTISELNRALRTATVWGGMDWHYNPLHPTYVQKCLDLIKAYHTGELTDLCVKVRRESQLNNIACIVAEVRSHWGGIDKFAGKHGSLDFLDEIAEALKAKESK